MNPKPNKNDVQANLERARACSNDVHDPEFQSKLDPYFTSAVVSDRWGKYQTWDKDAMRSALATARPKPKSSKFWANGILGVSSPVSKR